MSSRGSLLYLLVLHLCMLTLALAPLPALAEEETDEPETAGLVEGDEAEEIEEVDVEERDEVDDVITVTANRREENIQDAAISVTAMDSSFIEEVGLTSFAEMQKFTPNLQVIEGSDTRATSIMIRGIGSVGSNAGIDPTVAVFVDGIYQGRAGMSVGDLLDVSSIEVLRGPQGTLYGKNTAAGAIKIETKRPTYEPTMEGEIVSGNYSNYEGRFAGNLPLIDDVLATRFSGYGVTRNGYEKNKAVDHYDAYINDTEKWGLRSKTLWDVNDSGSLLFSGDYSKQDDKCCVADILEYGNDPNSVLPNGEDMALWQGLQPLNPPDVGDRDVYADVQPRNEVEVGGAAVEGTYELDEFTLTTLTGYRTYSSDSLFDGDFSEIDAITWKTKVNLDQVSTELRLVSPTYDTFDFVSGLYFYHSNMHTKDRLGFTEEYMKWTFFYLAPQFNDGNSRHRSYSTAGYADLNVNLSEITGWKPDISFTGGVRVGWERKEHKGSQIATGPLSDGSIPGVPETPISGPPSYSDQSKDKAYVTGRAILKYKPTEDIMLYTSFANGFKSGGYNQLRSSGAFNDPNLLWFDPEYSYSYEVGLKTTWLDRRVTANITAYFTDYKDFQAQIFDGLGIYLRNAGRFYTYGFESDVTVVPLPGMIWSLTVGLTETEYQDFDNGPCTQQQVSDWAAAQPPGSTAVCTQDLKGKRLAQTPKWNIGTFAAYENSLPGIDIDWFAQMDHQYTSNRYMSASLDKKLKKGAYNLLSFRAGLRHPESAWEVAAWVKNVTDKDWWAAGFEVPTLGGYAVFTGPPRTYGLTLRAKF